jgi:REP element-mobilizing transposase RayT
MSQSYCNLIYHIVFSIKNRIALLNDSVRPHMHQYLGGAIRDEGGKALIINGTADHIHILAKLRQTKAISDVIGQIKANSSGWVHRTFPDLPDFEWQAGYGAFTVSPSQTEKARRYIETQEQHHKKTEFKAEFLALLDAHEVEYDLRYIWD